MTSGLLKNISSAAGQTIVQTIVLLILYRFLLESIGVESLGVWSIVLATASAARISEMGMAGSITKFVASYKARDDDTAASEILQTALVTLGVMLGGVLLLAYPAFVWALSLVLPVEGLTQGYAILPYGLLSLWLTAVASVFMSGLDGCMRSDIRAGIMVFGSVAFLFTSLIAVEYYGLVGLAAAQVGQGIVIVVLGLVFLRRVMPSLPVLPFKWRMARFREMFSYGVNFQINTLVMLLFEPITKILLGRSGELAAAGYFEMAQRMVTKVRALIVESNRVIVPVFSSLDASNESPRDLYIRNMGFLLFLITPVFALLFAFIPAISELWVGSFQEQFILMGCCLTLAWYLNSVTSPVYFAYLGMGRLRWITVAHIVMGITNILLGLILGNYFGWKGIILAFAIALAIGSVIPFFFYHHEQKVQIVNVLSRYDQMLIILCFGAATLSLIGYWSGYNADVSMSLRLSAIVFGMVGLTLGLVWKHPLRRELFSIIRMRMNRG